MTATAELLAPTAGGRSLSIGTRTYPVVLPRPTDARLHIAAVITTLQVLGQTVFDFDLSIAQILVTVGTCAAIEFAFLFRRTGAVMWPASALLTANGTALILRVPGTEHGDWWSLHGWYVFAAVGALGIFSKWGIQVNGRHVFNPSNFALVVAFLVLGPMRADPQDLWWGPVSAGLLLAYAVITVGGTVIMSRLGLLGLAVAFWTVYASGTGALAASGHCMSARWSLEPVCGGSYWTAVALSPEVLVFAFFMITDPRTTPTGTRTRILYGAALGSLAALLVAPMTTEFATKVAILASLVVACALRPLAGAVADRRGVAVERRLDRFASRWVASHPVRSAAFAPVPLAIVAAAVLVAGLPARDGPEGLAQDGARPDVELPDGSVPEVVVSDEARALDPSLDAAAAQGLATDVLVALEVERRVAAGEAGAEEARAILTGPWLEEVLAAPGGGGPPPPPTFDRMRVVVVREPGNPQAVPRLGIEARPERGSGDDGPFLFVLDRGRSHAFVAERRDAR